MPWLTKYESASGATRYYVVWRENGKKRSRPLGEVPEDYARQVVEDMRAGKEVDLPPARGGWETTVRARRKERVETVDARAQAAADLLALAKSAKDPAPLFRAAQLLLGGEVMENSARGGKPLPGDYVPVSEAIHGYVAYMGSMGRAAPTINHNVRMLKHLKAAVRKKPMSKWKRRDLEAFIASKARNGTWNPRTTQMFLGACSRFMKWCHANEIQCADFIAGLRAPRQSAPEREIPSKEEVLALLEAADGEAHMHIVLALAAYAGLTRKDIRELKWAEVDLETGWIRRKRSKTGVPIEVPIGEPLREVLQKYPRTGERVCPDMLTDSGLSNALWRICDKAGVKRGGIHRLRHFFGTTLAQSGADLATIGRAMSHKHGSVVTARYLHTDTEVLRDRVLRAVEGVATGDRA